MELGGGRVVGDLRGARNGLVVVEHGNGADVGRHALDRAGQARPDVSQLGRQRGRHRPVLDAARPEPEPQPAHAGQLVEQAVGEVDVVRPVLDQDQPGGMPAQRRRLYLVPEVPGLLRRDGALAVLGGVVGRVRHGPADGQLVAGQGAVGRPHGHREPEVRGHLARVGVDGRSLRHPAGREPHLGCQVRVVQAVAIGDRVAQGHGARRGPCGGPAVRRAGGRARGQHDAPDHQGQDGHGDQGPRHGGAARRSTPRSQSSQDGPHQSPPGGGGGATLPGGFSPVAAGPGSRCGRRSRRSWTGPPPAPRPGARRARPGS